MTQWIELKSGKGESIVQNAMDFRPTLSLCWAHMGWELYLNNSSKRPRTSVKKFERNIFIWLAALYIKYYKTDLLTAFLYPSMTAQKLVSSTVNHRQYSLQWKSILASEWIKRAPSTRSRSNTANLRTHGKRRTLSIDRSIEDPCLSNHIATLSKISR